MIIVMKLSATAAQIAAVVEQIHAAGLKEHISRGAELVIIGAIGDEDRLNGAHFEMLAGVERVTRMTKQYKIVARDTHPGGSVIKVRGIAIGGEQIQVFAGPAVIEGAEQMQLATQAVQAADCRFLRANLFQGLGGPYDAPQLDLSQLAHLQAAARAARAPWMTELYDLNALDVLLAADVDVIQVGALQSAALLREVGRINKPIVLNRGVAASLGEWLMAAEHIAAGGNHHIMFCEQGARAGEVAYRQSLDVAAIAMLKRETHLPVLVNASQSAAWMVPFLAQAALAAGADGLLLDVHPTPARAWCGAEQALNPEQLCALMATLRSIASALGRSL